MQLEWANRNVNKELNFEANPETHPHVLDVYISGTIQHLYLYHQGTSVIENR